MKNILLFVHDDAGQSARLQAALDVTRALSGHLTCVDVTEIPMVYADAYAGAALAKCLADEDAREGRNRERLERRLASEDVCWSWHDYTGTFVDAILDAAGMADLIVLNRKLDAAPVPDMRRLTTDIIVSVRKPVLAVPDGLAEFPVGGRALIAWDGSAAVTATVRACIPLLSLSSSVRLFCAESYRGETDLNAAASYLSRHGIHAEIQRVYDEQRAVADIIMSECELWRADWCLMGGYGHGRLREELFGGVTRRMLGESRAPLVLCH